MSRQIINTPWRSHQELLETRVLLFPDKNVGDSSSGFHVHQVTEDAKDSLAQKRAGQRLGINIIHTWIYRGHVTHAIVATGLLVDALLTSQELSPDKSTYNTQSGNGNIVSLSPYAIKAMFATAISRFVTGFCDVGHAGGLKRSMYDVATDLGMPEDWVAMRHEITHGDMPSVAEMLKVAVGALDWLWLGYWALLTPSLSTWSPAASSTAQLKSSLKQLLRSRKIAIKAGEQSFPSQRYTEILDMAAAQQKGTNSLAKLLVTENLLCPSTKTAQPNMKAAFLIWQDALTHFARHELSFYTDLLEALQSHLMELLSSTSDVGHISTVEQWIVYLLTDHSLALAIPKTVRQDALNDTMEFCLLNTSPATARIADKLLFQGDREFLATWSRLFETSIVPSNTSPKQQDVATMQGIVEGLDTDLDEDSEHEASAKIKTVNAGGWKLLQGVWTPRPIGVLHALDKL